MYGFKFRPHVRVRASVYGQIEVLHMMKHCALIVNFTIPPHTGHSTIERDLSRRLCVEGIQKFPSNVAVQKPFEEIKKYFHTLMKKIFIFLHANLQAKILLNKMRSLIFPTRHQNRSLLFSKDITTINLSQQQHRIPLYSWGRGWKTIHAIYPVLAVSQDCYLL